MTNEASLAPGGDKNRPRRMKRRGKKLNHIFFST
jgi:hypothetical protein